MAPAELKQFEFPREVTRRRKISITSFYEKEALSEVLRDNYNML